MYSMLFCMPILAVVCLDKLVQSESDSDLIHARVKLLSGLGGRSAGGCLRALERGC